MQDGLPRPLCKFSLTPGEPEVLVLSYVLRPEVPQRGQEKHSHTAAQHPVVKPPGVLYTAAPSG